MIQAQVVYQELAHLVSQFYPEGRPLFDWVPEVVKEKQRELCLANDRLNAYREANLPA